MRWFSVLVLLGVACAAQPLRNGPTVDISPAFARHQLSVVTSADSNFQMVLAGLLPADILNEVTPLLPYVIVIQNHSQTPVTRTMVRYQRMKANGQNVDAWIQLNTEMPGLLLPSGATIVHAPRGDLSQMLTGVRSKRPAPGVVSAATQQVLSELFDSRRYPATTISLDFVVFKGGGIVGPDKFDLLGQDAASENARIEIATKVNDGSITDADLRAWLRQRAGQPMALIPQPDGSINHALSAQISWAKMTLQLLDSRGRLNTRTSDSALQPNQHFFRLDQ